MNRKPSTACIELPGECVIVIDGKIDLKIFIYFQINLK